MSAQRADWPDVFVPIEDPTRPITAEQVRASAPTPPLPRDRGARILDPTSVTLADLPPEWEAVPDLIMAQLAPQAFREVRGPGGTSYIADLTGIVTPEQKALVDKIAQGRWFVMRNNGPQLDRMRCGRCNRIHEYLTLGCVERPFHGLHQIVGMIETYQAEGKHVERILTSIRLGAIVPISRKQARQLADKIRAKGIPIYAGLQIEGR
jgi:hypothetical protein